MRLHEVSKTPQVIDLRGFFIMYLSREVARELIGKWVQ